MEKYQPHYRHQLTYQTGNQKNRVTTILACRSLSVRITVVIGHYTALDIQLMWLSPASLLSSVLPMMSHLHIIRWSGDPPHIRRHFLSLDQKHLTRCTCSLLISKRIKQSLLKMRHYFKLGECLRVKRNSVNEAKLHKRAEISTKYTANTHLIRNYKSSCQSLICMQSLSFQNNIQSSNTTKANTQLIIQNLQRAHRDIVCVTIR